MPYLQRNIDSVNKMSQTTTHPAWKFRKWGTTLNEWARTKVPQANEVIFQWSVRLRPSVRPSAPLRQIRLMRLSLHIAPGRARTAAAAAAAAMPIGEDYLLRRAICYGKKRTAMLLLPAFLAILRGCESHCAWVKPFPFGFRCTYLVEDLYRAVTAGIVPSARLALPNGLSQSRT